MQTFGIFETNFDIEYLTKHYIYINRDDEEIDTKQLQLLLKKKSKNVAGTIFLYNPTMAPKGYNNNSSLESQEFEFDGKFHELNIDNMCNIFASAIKDEYKGKLIEVKYLFNLNKANIEPTSILEQFDADLDRYYSNQLTRYDKELNYQDYLNISYNGKFVFFACGHKYDRHHKNIISYARNIVAHTQKLGKEIAFMYDNNYDKDEALDKAYFLSPLAVGKVKDARVNAFKKAFSTNPPSIQKLDM